MRKFDKAVGVFTILFLVLLLLKICGLLDIPWVIVVLPLWMPTAVIALVALVVNLLKLLVKVGRKRR